MQIEYNKVLFDRIANDDIKGVTYAIDHGANIHCEGVFGEYPIHEASRYNCVEVLRFLIDAGANIEQRNRYRSTPLLCTSSNDSHLAAEILISAGANIHATEKNSWNTLHLASIHNAPKLAEVMIKAGASVNAQSDGNKSSALHVASWHGYFKVAELLISAGANPNIRNSRGETPLHEAASHGHIEVLKALMDAGGDIDIVARDKKDVLGHALTAPTADCALMLMDLKGLSVESKINGRSLLQHFAKQETAKESIKDIFRKIRSEKMAESLEQALDGDWQSSTPKANASLSL
jgi:ankyrin repeat protein